MAISLSATFSPLASQSTNKCFTRVLFNPSPNRHLKFHERRITFSLRRVRVVASTVSGSPGTESPVLGEDTTSLLDTVKVFDLNGNGIPISNLWKDRKVVVAFARHFGCVFCRKRADYLASRKAKTFAEQTKFKGEVYADPSHSSYEALKFVSGASTTFTPKAGLKIIQLYMEGYRQDWKLSFERDTVTRGGWQQGGILVAGPGKNNISYIHKDKEAGDDPDIEGILKACCWS
ncbi:thioredoxin-like protein AAED1, chloroplastic isoform X3 [Carica papaya]|uniref:thioredoxin-like protein AAED1, chloroplastic isoform X3 n=1 Tax=Carica papaya TaxID=3649 RepID=UPI000B8D0EF3|nr:thioredoxin-like protein AAED1, chloroplastic isoform X3 [Carica papaya]